MTNAPRRRQHRLFRRPIPRQKQNPTASMTYNIDKLHRSRRCRVCSTNSAKASSTGWCSLFLARARQLTVHSPISGGGLKSVFRSEGVVSAALVSRMERSSGAKLGSLCLAFGLITTAALADTCLHWRRGTDEKMSISWARRTAPAGHCHNGNSDRQYGANGRELPRRTSSMKAPQSTPA